jgi:hypothetical protein
VGGGSSLTLTRRPFGGKSDEALEPQLPRERHLRAEQRRALEMLASAGLHGRVGATLLGHGFRIDMVADLVGDGLATARRETEKVCQLFIEVATDEGYITKKVDERRPRSRKRRLDSAPRIGRPRRPPAVNPEVSA